MPLFTIHGLATSQPYIALNPYKALHSSSGLSRNSLPAVSFIQFYLLVLPSGPWGYGGHKGLLLLYVYTLWLSRTSRYSSGLVANRDLFPIYLLYGRHSNRRHTAPL